MNLGVQMLTHSFHCFCFQMKPMWSCAIKLIVLVSRDIHLMSIVSFFGVSPLKIPLIIIWNAFHFFSPYAFFFKHEV